MSDPASADDDAPRAGAAPVVREIKILNKLGLHARPAGKFATTAERFDAAIAVTRGQETADGTSILDLLMLGASTGSTITISATGRDAAAAVEALCALVADRFGEDE